MLVPAAIGVVVPDGTVLVPSADEALELDIEALELDVDVAPVPGVVVPNALPAPDD